MKRAITALLGVLLFMSVIFLLPPQASAATDGEFIYTVTDGKATITDVDESISGDVTVPSELGGYPVVSIGASAFYNCTNMQSVTIPAGVNTIGETAFYNCSGLSGITIPASVTMIEESAFYGCESMTAVYISDLAAWCGIILENETSNPLYYAKKLYLDAVLLQELTIPAGVTRIEYGAFAYCTGLTKLIIADEVTSIGQSAFKNCSNLSAVTVGKGLVEIGEDAFKECKNISGVTVSDIAKWCSLNFSNAYANPLMYGKKLYINDRLVTDLIIPHGVTSINKFTFYNCTSLTSVKIPESVTYIGKSAFCDCSSLTGATLSDNIAEIGSYAFYECKKLSNIVLPEKLTQLGEYAFYYCNSLETVTIPAGLTTIGESAFEKCNSLWAVYISDIGNWCNIDFYNAQANPLYNSASLYINGKLVENLMIPYGVTTIKFAAFYKCENLSTVVIPESVTTIGKSVFSYCPDLTQVIIPDSVTDMGTHVFYECTALTTITFSENLTAIPDYTFYRCTDLTDFTISYNVSTIGKYSFFACESMLFLKIPGSVKTISDYAFSACNGIKEVMISENVTRIGNYAFFNVSIEKVYYTGSEEMWSEISFGYFNTELTGVPVAYHYQLPHSCTYGDWIITAKPTFLSEGERYKTCIVCGETVTEKLAVLSCDIYQWNVALEDDLAVRFYLQVGDNITQTAKVKIVTGDQILTHKITDLPQNDNGHYVAATNISAAQMNDPIVVMIFNDGELGVTSTYTVRQYCDTILANSAYITYHALVREMLNYGAMAQTYFGYETHNLANEGITGIGAASVPDTAEDMAIRDQSSGVDFYGASLVYRDKIAVRFYFRISGEISRYTFMANGEECEIMLKNGMYYIEVEDILPQNLDQQISLTVIDSNDETLCVTYGPMNYIVRMNEKSSDTLKNLFQALYNYHLAAKALV